MLPRAPSGGRCGAADVHRGSAVDAWLNGFVHENNSDGHEGIFFADGELSGKMAAAGFKGVDEERKCYTWDFDSVEQMALFVRMLFGLDRADPLKVVRGVRDILGYTERPSGEVQMNWELIYAFGVKE